MIKPVVRRSGATPSAAVLALKCRDRFDNPALAVIYGQRHQADAAGCARDAWRIRSGLAAVAFGDPTRTLQPA